MSRHEPVVVERIHSAISKSQCSCGAILFLGEKIGTPKQQHKKLKVAFDMHKKEHEGRHSALRQTA